MQVEAHAAYLMQQAVGSQKQVEDVLVAAWASKCASLPPFESMGQLHIFFSLLHDGRDSRGSYHKATETYFITRHIPHNVWARADWSGRVNLMADALGSGVRGIAKTRISPKERELIADAVEGARQTALSSPPTQLARVELYDEPEWLAAARAAEPPPEYRLFRRVDGVLHYRWAWFDQGNKAVVTIAGICGQRGEVLRHPAADMPKARDLIREMATRARREDFQAIPDSRMAKFVVAWRLSNDAMPAMLQRRHTIEEFLNAETCWLGLGHCDGGDIGSGEMAVYCFVADFKAAKTSLADALAKAGYGDFAEIRRS